MTAVRSGRVSPLLLVSLVANIALALAVAYFAMQPKSGSTADGRRGAGLGSDKQVNALGRIQPSGGLIAVYGVPGDQVRSLDVKAGATVAVKQKLGELSGEKSRDLSLVSLQKQIEEAEALRKAIRDSSVAKLADLEAEAKQANAGLDQDAIALDAKVVAVDAQELRYRNDLKRLDSLRGSGVNVPQQEKDPVVAALAMAVAERAVAQANKAKLLAQQEQAKESLKAKRAALQAETERGLAQVPFESLKAALELAKVKVADGELVAPTGGRVVRVLAHVGDTVGTMPLLQIAETNSMTVIAEVYETDVGKLRTWLKSGPVKVEASAGALGPTKLSGELSRVEQIAPVIAKNALMPLGPRDDADRRVVEVEVSLDSASGEAARNFLGLQVTATFLQGK